MLKISLLKILKNRKVFISTFILSIVFLSSCIQNTDTEQIREVQLRLNKDLSKSTDIELYLFRQNYLEQPELIDSLNTNSNRSISLTVNSNLFGVFLVRILQMRAEFQMHQNSYSSDDLYIYSTLSQV